ncbi:MAG: LemA family protein, partial [bacterium]|nr:LemA family protein [bacterium]
MQKSSRFIDSGVSRLRFPNTKPRRRRMGKIVGGVMLAVLVVFGVGACSVGLWAKGTYNDLVTFGEAVDSQIGQVQNVYQRRNDLLPNVAKTVAAYAKHEKGVFVGVAEMRAKVGQTNINLAGENLTAENLAKFQEAQGQIGAFLSRLMVVAER